ncbi:MAG: serine/threonine-protein phosphatase [Gemmatimonadetes bacterium]|nr:serine/threonine-protein phosphatase [Gemmatimonadota bacterium]
MLVLDCCALSEAGRRPEANEDFISMNPAVGLFAVADGMGGRPGGEKASCLAVETFLSRAAPVGNHRADHDSLRRIVAEVNRAVRALGESDPMLTGIGTTLSALVLDETGGTVVHVGDSRILRFRNGRLRQLTSDHTVEAEYRREASEAAAPLNPSIGAMLARAIGTRETVTADFLDIDVQGGDMLLLVTDGVSKVLEPAALEALLRASDGAEDARGICTRLLQAVLGRRPDDDATLGVVCVSESGSPGSAVA